MLASSAIGYYSPGKNSRENNILYIKKFDDNYLLGTPTGFHIFNVYTGKSLSFTDLRPRLIMLRLNLIILTMKRIFGSGQEGKVCS